MTDAAPNSPGPWRFSAVTRCGVTHEVNEDSFAALPDVGLFVVADGMGGHSDGGLASRSVTEMLSLALRPEMDLEERTDLADRAIRSVGAALWREAQARSANTVIGSTVAALLVDDAFAVCLWAGDSRIYLFREDVLYQLTRDHNVSNLLGAADAPQGPGAALTRAVGSSETVEVERVVTSVAPADTLLICSDGLTKALDNEAIGHLLDGPLENGAERLLKEALNRGARDDVTVIILRHDG